MSASSWRFAWLGLAAVMFLGFTPFTGSTLGQTPAEEFAENLSNPALYDAMEGFYAGDRDFLMNIHLRKGLGWPQVATLIIHRESGRLLMGALFSIRDVSQNRATIVVADEGFLRNGAPSGKIVSVDPESAGSAFYEAYRLRK